MKLVILSFLLFMTPLLGQYLDTYIHQGLRDNLALRQKDFSYQKSLAEMKEAKGHFMPSLAINARYSRASGGRTIDFPVGDLMNPVFDALNLTRIQSGLDPLDFPQLENEQIRFLREKEQETKLRLVQPIFNLAILYNYKARSRQADINDLERINFARQLVFEIKSGYYNYIKAVRAVIILERSEAVVRENLRVNKSLFDNDKVTRDVLYRAETELAEVYQQKTETINKRELAKNYFNYLLNRDLAAEISIPDTLIIPETQIISIDEGKALAFKNREEIRQISNAVEAAGYGEKAAGSAYFPSLTFVLDYGIQGEEYNFSPENDFWMASGVLQWNLFNGFQDQARKEQFQADQLRLKARDQLLKNQIELEVEKARRDLEAIKIILATAETRLNSALASFRIIEKKYAEGMSNQLQFLDSRSTATRAALTETIARTEYLVALSNWERVLASYPFSKLKTFEEKENE